MASPRQRRKVKKVMHEFKHGELKAGRGRRGKVKSRRQAIAIAMSESGQSRKRRGGRKSSASNGRKKSGRRKASTRKTATRSTSSRSTAKRGATRGRKKSAARGRKRSAR